MGRYKDNLNPEEISSFASKVGKLYLEQHKGDEAISDELGLHPRAVFQLRKLMGLSRRYGDIQRDERKVIWDDTHGVFKLSAIPLAGVEEELGLKSGGAYSWRAVEVSKGKLVLGFKEMKLPSLDVKEKKKKE